MADLIIISHCPGAPLFRLLGLGPNFKPVQGLIRLQKLLNNNAPWAKNRSINKISKMLINSDVNMKDVMEQYEENNRKHVEKGGWDVSGYTF